MLTKSKKFWILSNLGKHFRRCLFCGQPEVDDFFCLECRKYLPALARGWCPLCGQPYTLPCFHLCAECQSVLPPWSKFGFGCYLTGTFQEIVYAYKFREKLAYLDFFVSLLENGFYRHKLTRPDIILPIPLSKGGLRKRGFNQTLELAKGLQAKIGGKVLTLGLRKIRENLPQRTLRKKERFLNVQGVFALKADLREKKVLLLDDIYTTGATLREVGKVLQIQGVKEIEVLVLARSC
ncbi:MAG: hypothetical protein PWR24_2110 [Desulfonauticus sp.]|nr:MAG: Phosphoribosyltransferase [Desulfonauticus sp. 38_4375]MDK2922553.1 hypothetical protein [Desulfonauticus sp.]